MYSFFISHLGLCLTEKDLIHNGATLYVVACPILSVPCLLMPWRLKEPGHQQEWYWSTKLEYSISSTRRVKDCKAIVTTIFYTILIQLQRRHNMRKILTLWGQDKMVTMLQTTFSNAFSWTKISEFQLRFHWSLFIGACSAKNAGILLTGPLGSS